MIFLALVIQFKHAIKPFTVFAAIPFGVMGALISLWIMDMPFGFMAFLGVASLIGVIVTLLIVPALYATFVLDLKLVRSESVRPSAAVGALPHEEERLEVLA